MVLVGHGEIRITVTNVLKLTLLEIYAMYLVSTMESHRRRPERADNNMIDLNDMCRFKNVEKAVFLFANLQKSVDFQIAHMCNRLFLSEDSTKDTMYYSVPVDCSH